MDLNFLMQVTSSSQAAEEYLREKKCLRSNPPLCRTCMKYLSLQKNGKSERVWRCSTHKGNTMSIRDGSYFSQSKLPIVKILQIIYLWSLNTSIKNIVIMCKISERVAIQWCHLIRNICSQWLLDNPYQIGGPGIVVEVDETVISKTRSPKANTASEMWIFEGFCRTSGRGFMELIPDRHPHTLLPMVQKFILPGSVILSNKMDPFGEISQIDVYPRYVHQIVDHFSDPESGSRANTVESFRKGRKLKFKNMCGVQNTALKSHIDEYLWRHIHKECNIMEKILEHLSQWHVV